MNLQIAGTPVETLTASVVGFWQPIEGLTATPLNYGISSVGLYDAAGGTVTLTGGQQSTPVLKLTSGSSLTGNATVALGAVAACMFDIDATGIGLGGHTLTISNGAGTALISGLIGANLDAGPFIRCYCPSASTVVCGG